MIFRILIVDDDPSLLRILQFQMESAGYEVIPVSSGKEAFALFQEKQPDLVISDIKMPGMDGMELLLELKRVDPNTPVIMMTAHGSIETAIHAMKMGAYDYICKPFDKDELQIIVKKALDYRTLLRENIHLHEELLQRYRFDQIIGASESMKAIFYQIGRVSRTDSSVLLEGESGTGKELIARAIHYNSRRQKKPFVAINCAAIPEHLIESELFGHVKGAFTGAMQDRTGKFELAHQGTIFLDEIGDMRMDLQSKLLRVLQEHEIDKVGGRSPIPIDVRVIAAANKNLKALISEGKFREDLYYRLSVVPIRVPSLRERQEDIPLLVQHFLSELGGGSVRIETEVYKRLQSYNWPGNVRELQNAIEQAFVLRKEEDRIALGDIPEYIVNKKLGQANLFLDIPPEGIVLDEVERDLLQLALKKTQGNQNQAAKLLGITRQTLIYRMKKYHL